MAYLGKTPSQAVRSRYYFTASGSETSLSPTEVTGLSFTDANYVDVSLNGVALVSGTDYTATPSTNTISGLAALTASDVVEIVVYDTFSVFGGSVKGNFDIDGGNLTLGDNDKILIGDGSDLQISHDGSGSLILDNGTGNLVIAADELIVRNAANNATKADFTTGGAVNLYHNNAAKLATKSDGVDITGELQADSLDIDGNGTIDGQLTITTADNNPQLTLISTDTDASRGPELLLYRNSASPANSDALGFIRWDGENDSGAQHDYIKMEGFIAASSGAATGSEQAKLDIRTMVSGTDRSRIDIDYDGTVINQDARDLDFRVESNGNANMLVVDGGNNSVGIGVAAGSQESGAFLHSGGQCLFQHNHTDTSSSGNVSYLAGNQALTLVNAQGGATDLTCKLGFTVTTTGANTDGLIEYGSSGAGSGEFRFYTEASNTIAERMRVDSGGSLTIPGGDTSPQDNTSGNGVCLTANGEIRAGVGYAVVADLNRMGNDGTVILIRGQGVAEGSIEVNGSTVSLNGGHLSRWSQTADGQRISGLLRGTVMTNLDQMAVWSHDATEAQDAVFDDDGNIVTEAVEARDAYTEDNEQLNCMAVSSVEGDANVAGVFQSWDESDDFNDMTIAMTGDFVIRIAQGTTVARGDLLMSAGDGTAKPQGDDIVRSKTIAKVISTNVSHTYDDGSYLVPCVLMAC